MAKKGERPHWAADETNEARAAYWLCAFVIVAGRLVMCYVGWPLCNYLLGAHLFSFSFFYVWRFDRQSAGRADERSSVQRSFKCVMWRKSADFVHRSVCSSDKSARRVKFVRHFRQIWIFVQPKLGSYLTDINTAAAMKLTIDFHPMWILLTGKNQFCQVNFSRGVGHSQKSSYTPQKNPKNPKKNPKNPKKIQKIQGFFFADLKSAHLIWEWTTHWFFHLKTFRVGPSANSNLSVALKVGRWWSTTWPCPELTYTGLAV